MPSKVALINKTFASKTKSGLKIWSQTLAIYSTKQLQYLSSCQKRKDSGISFCEPRTYESFLFCSFFIPVSVSSHFEAKWHSHPLKFLKYCQKLAPLCLAFPINILQRQFLTHALKRVALPISRV